MWFAMNPLNFVYAKRRDGGGAPLFSLWSPVPFFMEPKQKYLIPLSTWNPKASRTLEQLAELFTSRACLLNHLFTAHFAADSEDSA